MTITDPIVPDWAAIALPDTWPDSLDLRRPRDIWQLMRALVGNSKPVQLPADMPGANSIPKYILQEFHNMPNGNYSRRFTRGYITGFNRAMLGEINKSHTRIAQQLAEKPAVKNGSVLDVGCGGGGLAGALQQAGVVDVWGLDPSPYLLQHAAQDWPDIRFVQGVAENTGFADARFDAITACFLLHEIPPRYIAKCVAEWARILKPGGWISLCEPSPVQLQKKPLQLWREYGWRGLYFSIMAKKTYEPFVAAWHQQDLPTLLQQHGFELVQHELGMPMRHVLARKC
jgi:ubiquinone/menaquinone biosynthesis C-methylase UbiE